MRKLIILSTLLLLAIGYLSWKYFANINEGPISNNKILKFIPQDATCILTINYDEAFNDLFHKYPPLEALLGEKTTEDVSFLNSLLLKELETGTQNRSRKIFISVHPNKKDNFNLLFSLSPTIQPSSLFTLELLSNKGLKIQKERDNIYVLTHSRLHFPVYIFTNTQVLLASQSKELLIKAINNQSDKIGNQFADAISTNSEKNRNTPIIISLNHQNLLNGIRSICRGKTEGNMSLFNNIEGESFLSMNYKNDALMFNGISNLSPESPSYLNLFSSQKPIESKLKKIIPDYASNYLLFSWSDITTFRKELDRYLNIKYQSKTISSEINKLHKVSGVVIDRDIRPYISNEMVSIETSQKDKMAIVKLTNGEKTNFSLNLISEKYSDNLGKLNYSNIFYYLLGDPLKSYIKPFYAIVDNYLILANTPSPIQKYLESYKSERFMIQNKDFQNHIQLVANKSNIEFFTSVENSEEVIKSIFRGKIASYFKKPYNVKNFYGLTWQWSGYENHFQVNIYANYNAPQSEVLKEVWNYNLDNRMNNIWGNFLHSAGKFFLVEDKDYKLYTFDESGKLIWKIKIDNIIQSTPQQLEDGSIVFNTATYIHRLDSEGKEISGFPIKLKNAAIGESCLLGYSPHSARLYIPTENSILSYPLDGTNHTYNSMTIKGRLLNNILIASSSNATFLLAATINGTFYYFSPNGTKIHETKINSQTRFAGNIYLARDRNNIPEIIASDTTGTIYRINQHGDIRTINVNNWSKNQSFQWQNITGDDKKEIILADNKQLSILSEDGIPMFSYSFLKETKHLLSIQTAEKNQSYIGISSNKEKKLYLFNEDGNLFKGFPVSGTGKFLFTKLLSDGNHYILLNKGTNKLYAYRL